MSADEPTVSVTPSVPATTTTAPATTSGPVVSSPVDAGPVDAGPVAPGPIQRVGGAAVDAVRADLRSGAEVMADIARTAPRDAVALAKAGVGAGRAAWPLVRSTSDRVFDGLPTVDDVAEAGAAASVRWLQYLVSFQWLDEMAHRWDKWRWTRTRWDP